MVPCMGTVTWPEPVPATAAAAARFGPAGGPRRVQRPVPRSGTQRRTE